MIQELLNVNPSTLDTISEYDYTEHLPFPKLNYVEQETGVNLIEKTRSDEQAKATLRYITKLTRDLIYSKIQVDTRPKLEFLIAKHEDYRKSFIDMVCGMVMLARIKGIESVLLTGEYGIKDLPKMIQAKGYMLFTNQYAFRLTKEQIRSDY